MIGTVHLLFGAVIGKFIGNPYLTCILAFVTHYLLDAVPHCQAKAPKGFREGGFRGVDKMDLLLKSVEPILGIGLTLYLIVLNGSSVSMLLGAFFGTLPDLLWFVEWKWGRRIRPPLVTLWEETFHRHIGVVGIIPQIMVMILCLLYLL